MKILKYFENGGHNRVFMMGDKLSFLNPVEIVNMNVKRIIKNGTWEDKNDLYSNIHDSFKKISKEQVYGSWV